mmetsp:Transcript_20969/g.49037  ORF Transcript_20969/g.49037 Transcript_20969/m.49037 type:complete len:263 (+) Transcript_20969:1711-2499(+)
MPHRRQALDNHRSLWGGSRRALHDTACHHRARVLRHHRHHQLRCRDGRGLWDGHRDAHRHTVRGSGVGGRDVYRRWVHQGRDNRADVHCPAYDRRNSDRRGGGRRQSGQADGDSCGRWGLGRQGVRGAARGGRAGRGRQHSHLRHPHRHRQCRRQRRPLRRPYTRSCRGSSLLHLPDLLRARCDHSHLRGVGRVERDAESHSGHGAAGCSGGQGGRGGSRGGRRVHDAAGDRGTRCRGQRADHEHGRGDPVCQRHWDALGCH